MGTDKDPKKSRGEGKTRHPESSLHAVKFPTVRVESKTFLFQKKKIEKNKGCGLGPIRPWNRKEGEKHPFTVFNLCLLLMVFFSVSTFPTKDPLIAEYQCFSTFLCLQLHCFSPGLYTGLLLLKEIILMINLMIYICILKKKI